MRTTILASGVVLLLSATAARAEPIVDPDDPKNNDPLETHRIGEEPNGYVSAGIRIDHTQGFAANGAVVEYGRRLGRSPWFGRVMGSAGGSTRDDEPGTGSYLEARGGLEARSCSDGGMVCGSAGVDLGVYRGEFDHIVDVHLRTTAPEQWSSVVVAPRLTLDAGGRIRFRVVAELPMQMRDASSMTTAIAHKTTTSTEPQPGTDHQFATGVAVSFGLAVGF